MFEFERWACAEWKVAVSEVADMLDMDRLCQLVFNGERWLLCVFCDEVTISNVFQLKADSRMLNAGRPEDFYGPLKFPVSTQHISLLANPYIEVDRISNFACGDIEEICALSSYCGGAGMGSKLLNPSPVQVPQSFPNNPTQ